MKIAKKLQKMTIAHAALVMIGVSATVAIAADKLVDVGKLEYEGSCAICHGRKGTGDGPFAAQMSTRMPNLALLAKRNGGVFPFDRVYQVIDGRQQVEAHGPRDMPIWGRSFRMQCSAFFEEVPQDSESPARSRILALIEYLYRLQEK